MAKFVDFYSDREVQDIMEKLLNRFPTMFEGFDVSKIGFVITKKKKSKTPIKLHRVTYPQNVWVDKVYIAEVFEVWWKDMDLKKRNLSVWRTMCHVPDGGFDEQSKNYGKILQPDIKMFMREYAAAGGVPNWMENPAATDPLDVTPADIKKATPKPPAALSDESDREPVTEETVASVGTK